MRKLIPLLTFCLSITSGWAGTVSLRRTQIPLTYDPQVVAVEDFNGDKVLDLVVGANRYRNPRMDEQGHVLIFRGNGDGTFEQIQEFTINETIIFDLIAKDLNGDDLLDLVVGHEFGIAVFLGQGDGTFQSPTVHRTGNVERSVAVGDFNNDGIPDIVTSNINVFLGDGDGTFHLAWQPRIGGIKVYVDDLNGDGLDDVVQAGPYHVSIYINGEP